MTSVSKLQKVYMTSDHLHGCQYEIQLLRDVCDCVRTIVTDEELEVRTGGKERT